jgi:hypothetical protein
MRCGGSRHSPDGGNRQGDYAGADAGNRPLACDMADWTGRSWGRHRLDLYLMHSSGLWSPGNQRIEFVVMELKHEAEVHLCHQRQPGESVQPVSSAQAHEIPQIPFGRTPRDYFSSTFLQDATRLSRVADMREPGASARLLASFGVPGRFGLFSTSSRRGPRPNLTRVNPLKDQRAGVILSGSHFGNGPRCALVS